MSVQAITWALSVRTRSASHKAVLLVLANYANDVGACWPSQALIAEESCCSISTVQRVLRDLQKDGLLERQTRRRPDGTHTSDRIELAVKHPHVNLTDGQSDRRSNTTEPPVKLTDPVEDKPLLEPTNEPLECSGSAGARETPPSVKQRCFGALGPGAADPMRTPALATTANSIVAWLRHGCDLEADILPVIAALSAQPRASPITTWKFFDRAVYAARDLRLAEPPTPSTTCSQALTPGAANGRAGKRSPIHEAAERAKARIRAAAAAAAERGSG